MAVTSAVPGWPADAFDETEAAVILWRADQFRALGFSDQRATELAVSDADLGQAGQLQPCGCAPELALRILR